MRSSSNAANRASQRNKSPPTDLKVRDGGRFVRAKFLRPAVPACGLEEPHARISRQSSRELSIHDARGIFFDGHAGRRFLCRQQAPVAQRHFGEGGGADAQGVASPRFDPKHLILGAPDEPLAIPLEGRLDFVHWCGYLIASQTMRRKRIHASTEKDRRLSLVARK